MPGAGSWREPPGLGGRAGPGREDPGGRYRVAAALRVTCVLAVRSMPGPCSFDGHRGSAGEVLAELVEPGFPGGALIRDPGLRRPQRGPARCGRSAPARPSRTRPGLLPRAPAGAAAPRAATCPAAVDNSLTDAGPRTSRSTMLAPGGIGERLEHLVQRRRLVSNSAIGPGMPIVK